MSTITLTPREPDYLDRYIGTRATFTTSGGHTIEGTIERHRRRYRILADNGTWATVTAGDEITTP